MEEETGEWMEGERGAYEGGAEAISGRKDRRKECLWN